MIMYGHNSVGVSSSSKPDLVFFVEYNDGSSGIVRCGPWVYGYPESIKELTLLQIKVCKAKELVNWTYVGNNFGLKKEDMMRLSWPKREQVSCSD
jgi:hypothetical protein